MNTKALWDGTQNIELTPRFKSALIELVEAEIEMMRKAPGHDKECWTWGEVEVGDLVNSNCLSFTFGGEDDRPKDHQLMARIIVK